MRSLFLFALIFLSACATTYENAAKRSWNLMKDGKVDEALKIYEKDVTSDKEKLLRLMDEGILLRVGKRYKESNEKFFAAAKIIDLSGYISLGEQSVTLLTNEKQTVYQGEDFEKVLIHLYLGLNFLNLKNYEAALVETRKVNEILFKMISESARPYELNAFAKYLGALLFENDRNDNDALVSYRETLKLDPSLEQKFPVLGQDLMRILKRQGMTGELEEFKKKFGNESWEKAKKSLDNRDGAAVLLFESGKSPEKYSSRERHLKAGKGGTLLEVAIPVAYYKNRPTQIQSAILSVGGQKAQTVILNDIERTAIEQLKDRMGRAMAKALLTAGVKAGIATGIGKATNNSDLGVLAGIALFLSSEADTRSWLLLPGELQVAKIFLAPGKYQAKVFYIDGSGKDLGSEVIPDVEIKSNRNTFIQSRSLD
ncbi:MAG: hypothetical protein J0L93_04080 [Deltaproteobacteria bacterium]|nr:hypothetical protein [Deltaproteobacteria bacterium]